MFSNLQSCVEDKLHPAIAPGYVCLSNTPIYSCNFEADVDLKKNKLKTSFFTDSENCINIKQQLKIFIWMQRNTMKTFKEQKASSRRG